MSGGKESSEKYAARQREHPLRERVRPKAAPAANADPWLLADEALTLPASHAKQADAAWARPGTLPDSTRWGDPAP